MTATCAIYCRISKDRTGAGLGVERQENECRELAARLGLTVTAVYTDNDLSAYSGKTRPGYRLLLAEIQAGRVSAVLAWHTDRIHRSPAELEEYIAACEQRGVPTHTVKGGTLDLTSASGRMTARIVGAVARQEVEHQIERQQSKKRETAAAGKWGGGRRPYGYEADGVTVRPDEARIVAEATDKILLGTSLRSYTAKLKEAGQLTSTGRQWVPTELKKVLIRPRNAGLREHRGQIIGKAEWEPIVAEEKWRAVRAMMADPARRTTTGSARKWLLSGIATCGICGSPVRAVTMHTTRAGVASYACVASKCVVRNAAEMDRYVELVTVERLKRPDTLDLMRPASPAIDLPALIAEENNLRERLDTLADDLDLDERTLARRSQRLRERLEEIGVHKAEAGRGSPLSGVVDAPDVQAAWNRLDLDRKRAIINLLMTIRVMPARKGRPAGWQPGASYFDPATIDIT
jgi:DNA invertase Pin-like site-specific DNA recombinase